MGLLKKPVVEIEDDEQIKREIRARVAKEAGIHDEEYIRTGKMSGGEKQDRLPLDENPTVEVETTVMKSTEAGVAAILPGGVQVKVGAKPKTEAKVKATPKPKTEPKTVTSGKKKKGKKQSRNVILLLVIIILLLLAFIPLYYYLTGTEENQQQNTTDNTMQTLQLYDSHILYG